MDRKQRGTGAGAKWAAALAVALLVAVAFFLPERLSAIHDRQLLNNPVIETQDGDQEGFAETIQLTVAEKLTLMRTGALTVTELSREMVAGVSINLSVNSFSETEAARGSEEETVVSWELVPKEEKEVQMYSEVLSQVWEARLAAVQSELRSLQAMGGMPMLWGEDSGLTYTGFGERLYMDPDTRMSFLVYHMTLSCEPYDLEVTVDDQSGRILSFSLRWNWIGRWPSWGLQGAANFGAAWRNYWGMDSVGGGWYSSYNRSILEQMEDQTNLNGDYDAHGQISFTYDGQTILVPLDGWAYSGRYNSLSWNI